MPGINPSLQKAFKISLVTSALLFVEKGVLSLVIL